MLLWLAAKFGIWDIDAFGAAISGPAVNEWIAFYGVKAEKEKEAMGQ